MDETLAWFLLAKKPDWAYPLDMCVTAYLIARADPEGKCEPKVADMVSACCVVQFKSVRESLKRLAEHEWIAITYRGGMGQPNTYTVNFEKLPRLDRQAVSTQCAKLSISTKLN